MLSGPGAGEHETPGEERPETGKSFTLTCDRCLDKNGQPKVLAALQGGELVSHHKRRGVIIDAVLAAHLSAVGALSLECDGCQRRRRIPDLTGFVRMFITDVLVPAGV